MFLLPYFLIAAGIGACAPLLLHLMQNKRKETLPFPTIRFLKMAEKSSSRKIRMENFLLWLLRTLIMALLGMAFAMPMLRKNGLAWFGDEPRDIAIVLDDSYSMNYRVEQGTAWTKAIETATAIINGLSDRDRFCIYLAHEKPEAVVAEPISNKKEALQRLHALHLSQGSSRLGPAISASMKALLRAHSGRERELHILTDHQALPWQGLGDKGAKSEIDRNTPIFVSQHGVIAPENTGVALVKLDPPVVRKGTEVKVTAHLLRTGPVGDTVATLFIDEKEAGRRPIKANDPDRATQSFSLPPLPIGIHTGRIQTPEDNLPNDDAFHFVIRVTNEMPSLVVGNDNETLFIRTALRSGFGYPSSVVTIHPENITDKPLFSYECIFLCNALPLPGQAIAALEDYVKRGGLLVLFPGMSAPPDAYKAWNCLPGIPSNIAERSPSQGTLTWDLAKHPLVRGLNESGGVPAVNVRRRLEWSKLDKDTRRIISMGADQPFLLERSFGEGRVLMCAVSADRTWSDFPLSPYFLPLLLQCAEYGAGVGAKPPFIWGTESLSLSDHFPELTSAPTVTGPDGKLVAIRTTLLKGKPVYEAENVTAPGLYSLSAGGSLKSAFAVNVPRDESDLTILDNKEIQKRLGVDRVNVSQDLPTLRQQIEEHRVGRTYGEHLLWLALLLAVIEFAYANLLMRGSQSGADQMEIDPAGRLKIPPSGASTV